MENTRSLQWAAVYIGLSTVAGLIGLAFVGAGVVISGRSASWLFGLAVASPRRLVLTVPSSVALIVLGVIVWKLGSTAAFYKTLVTAVEYETAGTLDTETIKSEILSVMDDRLSDMHYDIEQTRQVVNRMGSEEAAAEFEFNGD